MSESPNTFDWTGLITGAIKTVPEITGQYFETKLPGTSPVVIQAPLPVVAPMPVPYRVPTWVYAAVPAILVGGFLALKAVRKR